MSITVRNLTKKYGKFTALDDVSVSISNGCVGLLGPNGSGKSTFIKTLLSLVSSTQGDVEILGMDARKEAKKIRQKIGYMPEDDCFIPGIPGISAISFMGELSGLSPMDSLGRAHEMCDFVGFKEERYRKTDTYSTGMKQKMKFAQALVHDPSIIFLDEPTNGLDPASRNRMLKLIKYLSKECGKIIILCTHLLQDVEMVCDSAFILSSGKVLKEGTIADLTRPLDSSVTVKIKENFSEFELGLKERNCVVEPIVAGEYKITGDDARDHIIEIAAQFKCSLIKVQGSKNSLESVFLEAVQDGHN